MIRHKGSQMPTDAGPTTLETHAAWVLLIAFALSLIYELWRATAKAGVSRHDSMRIFLTQGAVLYGSAAIVIALLFLEVGGAVWIGLLYSVLLIMVSIFYYNPTIMIERNPGLIDWFENLVYTGLLLVAAAQLLYEVMCMQLVSP